MTKNILNADALRPKFIRLYSLNGTYGIAQSEQDAHVDLAQGCSVGCAQILPEMVEKPTYR